MANGPFSRRVGGGVRHHQDERGEERPAGTPPAQATGRAEMEVETTRERAPGRPWGRRNGPRASRAACWGTGWASAFLVSRGVFVVSLFLLFPPWYVRSPHYDRLGRSGARGRQTARFGEETVYINSYCRCFCSGGAAAIALRAACSGIINTRSHTHTHTHPYVLVRVSTWPIKISLRHQSSTSIPYYLRYKSRSVLG